jgi:hypothetical protein
MSRLGLFGHNNLKKKAMTAYTNTRFRLKLSQTHQTSCDGPAIARKSRSELLTVCGHFETASISVDRYLHKQSPERMTLRRGIPPPRDASADIAEMEEEEGEAIENYDYEKAMFLTAARKELRNTNIQDATAHYERQLEEYTIQFQQLLGRKKAANEEKYQRECKAATDRLQVRIDELAAAQKSDLEDLEKRWREARDEARAQIDKTVQTLLSSSKLLAKSKRFQEAIAIRDKARKIQSRKRHPSIDAVDQDYQDQFGQMLLRHEHAFDEMVARHEALLELFKEKRDTADRTAEGEHTVDGAYAPVEIMDTALCDTKNADVCIPVLQHFSPRAKKPASRLQKSTSTLDGRNEEEEPNE